MEVIFDSKLNWNAHLANAISKAKKSLLAQRLLRKYFNPNEMRTLLDSNFYSILQCFFQKIIVQIWLINVKLLFWIGKANEIIDSFRKFWYWIDLMDLNESIFPERIICPITIIFRLFFLDWCNRLRLLHKHVLFKLSFTRLMALFQM